MNPIKQLIDTALKWEGYLEKKSNKELDSFTANAGSNNYTCFSRDYQRDTGLNLQAQPWCAMFVSEVIVQAFGLEKAVKLLYGALYHYCPTGVNQFKAAGRWFRSPEPGDVIFFTNNTRAYHTGIVIEVTSNHVKTIEGNTSGASGVIENGGSVCRKSYSLADNKILGYGRPDYKTVIMVHKSGWYSEDGGHRFYNGDTGEPVRNSWHEDPDGSWYWFNGAGLMVTNIWYQHQGAWYYMGSDGAMTKGLQDMNGKWYYMGSDGKMAVDPVILTPDQDGALQYSGLAQ